MNFDWVTFAFQLVNVLVLLAILRRVLFRPVAGIIARRQAETDAALQAADAAKAEAEAAIAKARAEAETTAAARHDVLVKAQEEAEAQRKALLDRAHDEAAKIVAEGRESRAHEAGVAQARAVDQARDLASVIAARALAAQPAGIAGYAERLAAALNALTPEERGALLAGANLRLTSAAPLSPADCAALDAALAPFAIQPGTETDPGLLAGVELRSDSGAIRNSLAHDLDRIARAMKEGKDAA